jgi:hypothetical protein
VLVNPVGIFYGPLIAEFGFGLGSNASLNLHGARWDHLDSTLPGEVGAWGLGAGAQLFPTGPIYEGLFAYPSIEWLWVSIAQPSVDDTMTETTLDVSAVVPKLIFGYQFDWKAITLRLGLGGYYVAQLAEKDVPDAGLDGLRLAIDLSFGLTF